MPQFAPRRTQPPRPDSYIRMAGKVRALADRIESLAHAETAQDRRSRTLALVGLIRIARHYWLRVRGS